MGSILIFGPAYLDVVVEIARALVPGYPALTLDQSAPASHMALHAEDYIQVCGPTGDDLRFPLLPDAQDTAATYHLGEPVLARMLGRDTRRTVVGEYPVTRLVTQIGGMGAGYALALRGTLRMPVGGSQDEPDAIGQDIIRLLGYHGISTVPCLLTGRASDTSLVILSTQGDKLAIGVRDTMVHWRVTREDRALVEKADALVFCGAPNALMAEVLAWQPSIPVMCAPAMRNVCDATVPLVELAPHIHYLTLNALEWAHLEGQDAMLRQVPVISVTDGAHGSRVLFGDSEVHIPAVPRDRPANTNRAGETYGSTFFKVLMAEYPNFYRAGYVTAPIVEKAGRIAGLQAARQLDLRGFAFPEDDWM